MKRLFAAIILAIATATPASAEDETTLMRIAAVVNDEMVSVYDLQIRLDLTLFTSGIENTPEARERMTPTVLRQMITETIQLQEAERLGIEVTAEDIQSAIAQVERNNGMPRGGLIRALRANDVELRAYIQQLRATIAWQKIVQQRLARQVRVSDDEVNELLARLEAQSENFRYHLYEIFLPVDTPEQDEVVRRTAERLMTQIRRGIEFSSLAQQFSQSGTAAVGGDMGKLFESQIDPALRPAVRQMRSGEVMGPIRTVTGYYILFLRSRETLTGGNPDDTIITLGRVVFSLEGERRSQVLQNARDLRSSESCDDLVDRGREAGARASVSEDLIISRLPSFVRSRIQDLETGQIAQPIVTPEAVALYMVCERRAPGLPTAPQIRRSLRSQKLEARARRYLRDLRRNAAVEIRI